MREVEPTRRAGTNRPAGGSAIGHVRRTVVALALVAVGLASVAQPSPAGAGPFGDVEPSTAHAERDPMALRRRADHRHQPGVLLARPVGRASGAATLLWRFTGQPDAPPSDFLDVQPSRYYEGRSRGCVIGVSRPAPHRRRSPRIAP